MDKKSPLFILIAALLALFSFYVSEREEPPAGTTAHITTSRAVILSDSRAQHILYGDHKGGGHRHGAGKPCKSEFPQAWDDAQIIDVTRKIAANDNLDWERQDNGYYVAESFEGSTKVRVVLGREKRRVITSYPVNVRRNPCDF